MPFAEMFSINLSNDMDNIHMSFIFQILYLKESSTTFKNIRIGKIIYSVYVLREKAK